jgi:hypothetical protein
MELALCYPSGAQDFEMVPRFFEIYAVQCDDFAFGQELQVSNVRFHAGLTKLRNVSRRQRFCNAVTEVPFS